MKKLIIFAAGALFASPVLAQNETVPAAPAAAAATPATPEGEGKIKAELKIGTDIKDRDVVGESDKFGADVEKLIAWTRVTGADKPTKIWHVWKRNGEEVSKVALNVTSSFFRTYSRKDIKGAAGNWTVEVKDANGKMLASKDFTVGDTTAAPAK